MSQLSCPYCGGALQREEKIYKCLGGHCFDVASQGYVNLLPPNKKHSKDPGDDRGMVAARNRFLSAGYYEPLLSGLCGLSLRHTGNVVSFLDSGCGEGYYTQGVFRALTGAGRSCRVVGIDISRYAARLAARRLPEAEFAVASAYALPCGANSMDLLLNCFSPLSDREFCRVLRPGGCFLYVVPGPEHLWQLKCAAYDEPYRNVRKIQEYEGFELVDSLTVSENVFLPDRQTVSDLFSMTPYLWNTPESGRKRLEAMDSLETRLEFDIYVYRKL